MENKPTDSIGNIGLDAGQVMLGNLFCYDKPNGYVCRVIGVARYGDSDLGYEYAVTCQRDRRDPLYDESATEVFNVSILHPISITQEILESNGIKMEFCNLDSVTTIHRKVSSVYDNWVIERYGWKMVEVRYMHELQNVLNVCGIKRDISVK